MEFKDEDMLHCFRDVKQSSGIRSRVSLQELDIKYMTTFSFFNYHVKVAEQLKNHFTF